MNHIIVWSGGYDSTLVLLKFLKNKPKSDSIYIISHSHSLVGSPKNIRESEARSKILSKLEKDYHREIKHIEIKSTISYSDNCNDLVSNSVGLAQPLMWILQTIPLIPDDSTLYFGYLKDDQSVVFRNEIESIIRLGCSIQYNKRITVSFPLLVYTKYNVIRDLIILNPDYLDLCTTCESVDYTDNCGYCESCVSLRKSLIELSYLKSSVGNIAKSYLKKLFHINVTINKIEDPDTELVYNSDSEDYEYETNN